MHHDHHPDHASAHAPACRPAKLLFAVAGLELNSTGAGKILPEEMRGPGLDSFAILDHGFEAKCLNRAGKAFAFRFLADENRDCEIVAVKGMIDFEHLSGFGSRFFLCLVNRMAFLPE